MTRNRTIACVLCLFLSPVVLFLADRPAVFGNAVDWYSQHVVLGETIRDTMRASRSLFCDFIPQLYGGVNFYAISYYGYLRPDVLFATLFPSLEFAYILIAYAVFLMGLAAVACFFFLKANKFSWWICFALSLGLPCTTLFFQSHRQIMFVNFIPFLFLMLYGVDRILQTGKTGFVILGGTLLLFHSFYFAPACYLVALVYYAIKGGSFRASKPLWLSFLIIVLLGAPLWLPTGLYLLENKRPGAAIDWPALFVPDWKLSGLLYNRYGCGQPLLAWFALVYALFVPKTRLLALCLLAVFLFPVFWYVFSGFLYARTKALLPLMPFVIGLEAFFLQSVSHRVGVRNPWILAGFFLPVLTIQNGVLWWDILALGVALCLFAHKTRFVFALLAGPLLVWNAQNPPDSYLKKMPSLPDWIGKIQNESIALIDQSQLVNATFGLRANRSSGYASIYPKRYNEYIFDLLKVNIPINNRTAILDSTNPFYLFSRGIQWVQADTCPPSFETVAPSLYRATSVLPRFYLTRAWMDEKTWETLPFPDTLQAMIEQPCVSNAPGRAAAFQSRWKTESFPSLDRLVRAEKTETMDIALDPNRITVLQFDIENHDRKKPVVVDVNGMRNKLSPASSVYYNHNTRFTFVLAGGQANGRPTIQFSAGNYTIKNTTWCSIDASMFQKRLGEIEPVQAKEGQNRWSLTIDAKEDAILVTPFSDQAGFSIRMDGTPIEPVRVNKTFIGCPVLKGCHQIDIVYEAPGKKAGIAMAGFGIFLAVCLQRRWKQ